MQTELNHRIESYTVNKCVQPATEGNDAKSKNRAYGPGGLDMIVTERTSTRSGGEQ